MWKLYVLPDHQRRSIGSMLVRAAKDRARREGTDLLTEYEPTNGRVRGFCVREGFRATAAPFPGSGAVWLRWQDDAEPRWRSD